MKRPTKSIKILDEDLEIIKRISLKEEGRMYYLILSRAIKNYAIAKKLLID